MDLCVIIIIDGPVLLLLLMDLCDIIDGPVCYYYYLWTDLCVIIIIDGHVCYYYY